MWKQQVSQVARLGSYKAEIGTSVDLQVKLGGEDFYRRLESFKARFIMASRGLGSRLDNVELCLIGLSTNTPSGLGEMADHLSRERIIPTQMRYDAGVKTLKELRIELTR
jgi:hypothetical protein